MTKLSKEDVKKMSEELLLDRKNPFFKVEDEKVRKADEFCEGYKKFLNESKTEREAVRFSVKAAEAAGFVPFDPAKKYNAGDKVYYNNRGKALILAVIGKNGCKNGVRIAAAHIDCPRLDLKPHPLYEKNEIAFFKTHYYGGVKKYQWTAIPPCHARPCGAERRYTDGNLHWRRGRRSAVLHHRPSPAFKRGAI
jgi:hypothetical protein